MKLHFLSNGQKYGWGKLRSIFDFFFPYLVNGDKDFIRCEMTTSLNNDGKVLRDFYTFRALFFHYFYTELNIVKELFSNPYKNLIPRFAFIVIFFSMIFRNEKELLFLFPLIAVDATSTGGGAPITNVTISHTCTGSNGLLVSFVCGANNTYSGTYNSAALTELGTTQQTPGDIYGYHHLFYKLSPSTGTNNIVINTGGATLAVDVVNASYSGCSQSSFPDSSVSTTSTAAATWDLATTVVANNCWLIAGIKNASVDTLSNNADTTRRINGAVLSAALFDSNAIVGTGSRSLKVKSSSGSYTWGGKIFSIAPSSLTYTITIAQGAYALTGQTLSLIKALIISLAQGAYTLTGQILTFSVHIAHAIMTMGQGAYTLTGETLALFRGMGMGMIRGVYALTGEAVMLSKSFGIVLAQGAYTLTGEAATFIKGQTMRLITGIYTLIGSNAMAYLNGNLFGFWKKVASATDRVWRKVSKNR